MDDVKTSDDTGTVTGAAEAAELLNDTGEEALDLGNVGELPIEEKTEAEEETEAKEEPPTKQTGPTKLNASERVQQAVNAANEAKAEIEELKKVVAANQQAPDYVEVDYQAVNQHVGAKMEEANALRAAGRTLEALALERGVQKLVDDLAENERKKVAATNKSAASLAEVQAKAKTVEALSAAAETFRASKSIPSAVWEQRGASFIKALEADPALQSEFAQRVTLTGPAATVKWANSVMEELEKTGAKQTAVDVEKKDAGKKKLGVLVSVGGKAQRITTRDELMKMHSSQITAFKKANPKEFNRLMDMR